MRFALASASATSVGRMAATNLRSLALSFPRRALPAHCFESAQRLNKAALRSGAGFTDWLGRTLSASSLPPSGLRVGAEDA
jgi:hypothetical protein